VQYWYHRIRTAKRRGLLKGIEQGNEMNRCFSTVVSGSHQELIPLYVYALKSWSNDDIVIFIRGEIKPSVLRLIDMIDGSGVTLIRKYAESFPDNPAVTAAVRFICCEEYLKVYDYVMFTDVDLLLLVDMWDWYITRITKKNPFAGHHGAWSRPQRPKICVSWRGEFERVTGGLFCISNGWWDKTREQRTIQSQELKKYTEHYREEDEVILGRIIKRSGMRIPAAGSFPHDYRGVHIGDFKFDNRWKSMVTMKGLLTDTVCKKYIKLRNSALWKNMVSSIDSNEINAMLRNVDIHISERFS
jgi:hypothetical protein